MKTAAKTQTTAATTGNETLPVVEVVPTNQVKVIKAIRKVDSKLVAKAKQEIAINNILNEVATTNDKSRAEIKLEQLLPDNDTAAKVFSKSKLAVSDVAMAKRRFKVWLQLMNSLNYQNKKRKRDKDKQFYLSASSLFTWLKFKQ